MFRAFKIIVFIALLAVTYGLHYLSSTKQREQEALAWSNRLVWDALGSATQPHFAEQSVATGARDDSWRVTGRLTAKSSAGAPIEGSYHALVVQHCAAKQDARCWALTSLKVGDETLVGEPEPQGPTVTASQAAAPATAESQPLAAADAAPEPRAAPAQQAAPPGEAADPAGEAPPPPAAASGGPTFRFSAVPPGDGSAPVAAAVDAATRLAQQIAQQRSAAATESQQSAPTPPAPMAEAGDLLIAEGAGDGMPSWNQPTAGQQAGGKPAVDEAAISPAAGQAAPRAAPAAAPATGSLPTVNVQVAALALPEDAGEAEAPSPQAPVDPSLLFLTQDRLLQLGYGNGRLSRGGGLDGATQEAILAYQRKNGLPTTGQPSRALLDHMERYLTRLNAIDSGQAAPKPAARTEPATGGYISFRKGLAAAERGQIDEAIAHYTRAIESTLWRERYMAYVSRGKALAGQGNYRQAINDYSAAIDLRPDYTAAWVNRGLAYAKLNQREQALADLQQAQALDPNSASAARALRYLESLSQAD